MNHGGRAAVGDFGRTVSKVAVAQICESAGFHSVRESALEALADISLRYLSDLGKMAEFYANLAGRSQCNVFDVIRSLEDLETSQGFPGASEASQCLSSSGTIKQIVNFVGSIEEIPFAHPIPQFPVIKDRKTIPSFIQMDETPPNKHIPAWLPAFPDPHTYISTSMWNERTADPLADKINQARQRRKAERSLLSLQQRLICNGTAAGETSTSRCAAAQDQGRVEENSFLQTPIPSGEKDVSSIVLPSKLSDETVGANRVSVLEAFAPAIEIAKNSGLCEDGEEEKMVLPVVRPTVHFKFRTGKKLIGESLDMRQQKKDIVGTASLTVREDESQRDEKKRRAEYILKQSMENPQELTML